MSAYAVLTTTVYTSLQSLFQCRLHNTFSSSKVPPGGVCYLRKAEYQPLDPIDSVDVDIFRLFPLIKTRLQIWERLDANTPQYER